VQVNEVTIDDLDYLGTEHKPGENEEA
jgi:hypothetical protein